MRSMGFEFALGEGGPTVKTSEGCPMTSALLSDLKKHREAIISLLWEEQHPPAAAVAPPAPAPWAQVEPAAAVPAPEPERVRGVAQPAQKLEPPKAVLVAGASVWGASKGDIIRERLGRLPAGVKVLVFGNVEARSRKGLPVGVPAITRVALLDAAIPVEIIPEDGLDEALARVGQLIVFHSALERSVWTAAVVDRARTLRIPVEMISGSDHHGDGGPTQ